MTVKCPKCASVIVATPDALGLITCNKCGARLRTKQAMRINVLAGTIGSSPQLSSVLAPSSSNDTTLRPGPLPRPPAQEPKPLGPEPKLEAVLESLLTELKAIRAGQQEMLGLLRGRPAALEIETKEVPGRHAVHRPHGAGKMVLLVDDDAQAQRETAAALGLLASVKTAADGNEGLASIALEKPDAIVLELAIGGPMPGRDFVNLVKATMEWIDIPLLLHTRLDLGEENAARMEHGADGVVRKGPGSAMDLAARLRELFTAA